jgi:NADH-quinone oxidoreductase subunit L
MYRPILPALVLALPLAGAIINGVGAFLWREDHRVARWVGPLAVGASFVVVAINFFAMKDSGTTAASVVSLWTWIAAGGLHVGVDLQFDRLSMVMMLIVTGVSTLIHIYSIGYMRGDPGFNRYFAYLNLFVFFMLVLVTAASFPLMFVGWEGVGLCSYLLIGFWYENEAYSNAGKKAFIVNRIGDFGFLVAMFIIYGIFGSLDFSQVLPAATGHLQYGDVWATLITLFLFLACMGKSAQIPLYVWLPDAMAGPTPVSALIHAATMVTAGVYLVARTSVLFALAPVSQAVVATVGAGTALFAATIATQQWDIKKVLAYSTISQLGYMFLAVGVGAFTAGIFHLMTHAFFKALLFLGAGAVIHSVEHAWHEAGRHGGDPNDMRNHGDLRRWMPVTWITMWSATLAISGVFPFAGFFSKDEVIWKSGVLGYPLLWGVALVAAFLTAGYMARLMALTFHGGENRTGEDARGHLHGAPLAMAVPLVVLGVLSLVGGWIQIPESLPLPHVNALEGWLDPVFEPAHHVMAAHGGAAATAAPLGGGELTWGLISTVVALAVVVWIFLAVVRRHYRTAAEAPEPTGLSLVLYRKWYVDELYDRLIVRPLMALWRGCWKIVDDGLIDGTVNRLASGARAVGWVGSQLQSGRLGAYLLLFMVGVLVILGTVAF